MRKIIHNKKELKEKRKSLRNNMTPAEAKLWNLLKNKGLEGKKFRRQHSVGPYILDFYCPSEKLCIELDGEGHYTSNGHENDQSRSEFLANYSIKVCRIENKRVFENIEGVLQEVIEHFMTTPNPS